MGADGVLLMWLFFLSGVGAVVAWLLRMWINEADSPEAKPRHAVFIATVFPWCCIAWAFWVCGVQAHVDTWSGRDVGYGDVFRCPLPNGYEIKMIDDLSWAWLSEPHAVDAAMDGIQTLQIAGPWFAGATSEADARFYGDTKVNQWFLIDTRTKQTRLFKSEDELSAAASFKLALEPVSQIYGRYRWTRFDELMQYLLFIPPQIAFGLLLWWLRALRAGARPVQATT